MKSRVIATVTLLACALVGASTSATALEQAEGPVATFEGQSIDLTDGWGDATACYVDSAGTRCYRDETALRDAEQLATKEAVSLNTILGTDAVAATTASRCSTSLRLYSGTSYTGSVLYLAERFTLVSLSSYGFSNVTSSYKVGACNSYLYDGIGSGLYPGSTGANASASSMLSGWNDKISSVYVG